MVISLARSEGQRVVVSLARTGLLHFIVLHYILQGGAGTRALWYSTGFVIGRSRYDTRQKRPENFLL